MDKVEQKIEIAKALGITVEPCTCQDNPWRDAATKKHLRDYPSDLNAMAEAEKMLFSMRVSGIGAMSADPVYRYMVALTDICGPDHLVHASAAQRAEAFLRVLGKWKEAI